MNEAKYSEIFRQAVMRQYEKFDQCFDVDLNNDASDESRNVCCIFGR
jgi:hypothetical protein